VLISMVIILATITIAAIWFGLSGAIAQSDFFNYSTKPLAVAGAEPGPRSQATSWASRGSKFWLFGGLTYSGDPNNPDYLNDLWSLKLSDNTWELLTGSGQVNQPGIYGTKGQRDPKNTPGARKSAIFWTARNGNLWLFGGFGFDSVSNEPNYLNDLWRFEPATGQWTWISGSDVINP